ncbi:hypothetical protein NM688_g3062 [Phlebia brevispora]|uniref:Uncharacterized protein n=1 Tax=Phlebia brevispora TaxID=194682 RepID=A0ACC1T6Q3_9APHY|nr:hypothetical protein NM688_g3062 [Phlebia brevispora]
MTQYDFTDKSPFTVDEAIAALSDLPATTTLLRMRLGESSVELLSYIASRFTELRELTLLPKLYGHPFGDTVVTSDDFATEEKLGISTDKALAIAVGRNVGTQYAAVLRPLQKIEQLSLGVSLYGPYGSVGKDDEEPEVKDIETSMNLVASERIARALPSLQRIVWQKVTSQGEPRHSRRRDDDDGEEEYEEVFELHGLNFTVVPGYVHAANTCTSVRAWLAAELAMQPCLIAFRCAQTLTTARRPFPHRKSQVQTTADTSYVTCMICTANTADVGLRLAQHHILRLRPDDEWDLLRTALGLSPAYPSLCGPVQLCRDQSAAPTDRVPVLRAHGHPVIVGSIVLSSAQEALWAISGSTIVKLLDMVIMFLLKAVQPAFIEAYDDISMSPSTNSTAARVVLPRLRDLFPEHLTRPDHPTAAQTTRSNGELFTAGTASIPSHQLNEDIVPISRATPWLEEHSAESALQSPTPSIQAGLPAQRFHPLLMIEPEKDRAKKHLCELCAKRFPRPSALVIHMYTHSGIKRGPSYVIKKAVRKPLPRSRISPDMSNQRMSWKQVLWAQTAP